MLKRRPSTAEEIAEAFGMHFNEVCKYLGNLLRQGRIRTEHANGSFYYNATIQEQIKSSAGVNTAARDNASDPGVSGASPKEESKSSPNKEAPFSN
jgi:hypothetical protein